MIILKKSKHSYIFERSFKIYGYPYGYYVSNQFKCYSDLNRVHGMLIETPFSDISEYIGYEFYC